MRLTESMSFAGSAFFYYYIYLYYTAPNEKFHVYEHCECIKEVVKATFETCIEPLT